MIDIKIIKAFGKGLLTYLPGVIFLLDRKKRITEHSGADAMFCYTLWLSILVHFKENDIIPDFEKVGELGNGGSLGVGICAILSGTKQYFALEIENRFNKEKNLKLLDDLVTLFKNRTPIYSSFKQLNIHISNFDYPSVLITPRFSDNKLVNELRNEINSNCTLSKHLNIVYNYFNIMSLNLDFIFSRAVMEHVKNPNYTYKQLVNNLKPGGYTFHDIELHSHGITKHINGHLQITNIIWRIIFGMRTYFLNRWKFSDHINALESLNFKIIRTQKSKEINNISTDETLIGATVLAKLT